MANTSFVDPMGMRASIFVLITAAAASSAIFAQPQSAPSAPQQPNHQPGWPCTGKEQTFDPAYSRVAEATGGHLFLFDRSEAAGWSTLLTGDAKHKATIVRAAGKTDSYVDIPFWVDASVESLFVVASLQCMQTIYLYDPQRSGVDAKTAGTEDNWFRAGRISTVEKPTPGSWVVRLLGTGPYGVAVEAKTATTLGGVERRGDALSISMGAAVSNPVFRLINAAGEPIQTLALAPDPNSSGRFSGTIPRLPVNARLQAEWRGANGELVWRTDPRLWEPGPPPAAPVK